MSRWKEGSDRIKGDRISGVTAIIYHHLPLYLLLFFSDGTMIYNIHCSWLKSIAKEKQ